MELSYFLSANTPAHIAVKLPNLAECGNRLEGLKISAFNGADRGKALSCPGFSRQMVFSSLPALRICEEPDPDMSYGP